MKPPSTDEIEIEVSLPPLAKFKLERRRLRARYKGKLYKAIIRSDGRIRYDGVVYDAPSSAASAIIGHAANGWQFWRYERAPGEWVQLLKLRKKQPRRTK